MGLPHDLCARLVNGAKARHRYVAVPPSRQHSAILSLLASHGFINSYSLGSTSSNSKTAPEPETFAESPYTEKRLWAELKYRDDRPVLNEMKLISHPSRRVSMSPEELKRFIKGSRVRFVPGLTMGEVAVVLNKQGEYLEGWEAVRRNIGGEVLVRVK